MLRAPFYALMMLLALTLNVAAHAQEEMAQMFADLAGAEPVALTESDVERWIKTSKSLIAADVDGLNDNASISESMRIIESNNEAMSILKSNGYDTAEFQSHSLNIVMAAMANEVEANKAEIEASLAQLEMMKGQLPEAQYEMLASSVNGLMSAYERTPKENLPVVAKFREEIEQLGED